VQYRNKRWGGRSDAFRQDAMCSYMTKYLAKDFEIAGSSKKHYWVSKNVAIPTEVFWLGATNFCEAVAESYHYARAFGLVESKLWASDDWRFIWIDCIGEGDFLQDIPF